MKTATCSITRSASRSKAALNISMQILFAGSCILRSEKGQDEVMSICTQNAFNIRVRIGCADHLIVMNCRRVQGRWSRCQMLRHLSPSPRPDARHNSLHLRHGRPRANRVSCACDRVHSRTKHRTTCSTNRELESTRASVLAPEGFSQLLEPAYFCDLLARLSAQLALCKIPRFECQRPVS